MKKISETQIRYPSLKPDEVVLGTLSQAIRGCLLIIFNWTLFIQFGRMRSIPGIDIMVLVPPSVFFIIGFLDIFLAKRVWQGDLTGWRYGIAMGLLILLFTPGMALVYLTFHTAFLYIVIDFFTVSEIILLVVPESRRFFQT